MATFKVYVKELMLKKSVELGYPLTRQEVADKAGLSLPLVSRWYRGKIDRLEADKVAALMNYFGCTFNELVEFVND